MDIKVYRFINSHAMTQIIFYQNLFCNDFIKYILIILILIMKSISILRLTAILFVQHAPIGIRLTSSPNEKWVNYSPDLTTVLKKILPWDDDVRRRLIFFREHATIKQHLYPRSFWKQMKNAKQLIIPIFCTSECCGKIWNLRRANMHGFTMNGINGIYKKPKTRA